MREQGKLFRLAYERFSLPDDLVLVCIPEWFRYSLLDMTMRMLWSRVWTDSNGNEVVLSESERTRVEYGIWRLCQEECDMVINVNQSQEQNQSASGGAGGSGGTTIPIYTGGAGDCACLPMSPPGSEYPPPVTITPGIPPEGWPSYPAYDAARCAISNYGWQLAYEWITALSNVSESALSLAAFVFFLLNTAPSLVFAVFSASAIATLLSFLAQVASYGQVFDDFFEDLKAWMVNNRQSLVCQGYNAQSEIPLFESVMTSLESHMEDIWADRQYTETVIYLLSKLLQYSLPSSVMGLFLSNEDEDFFGNYIPPLSCDTCGTPPPGQDDAWETVYGLVGAHSHTYSQNTETDYALDVDTAGGGAGLSYQQAYNRLISLAEVDPDSFTFNAVTFTVTVLSVVAPTGNAAQRRITFGGINNDTQLLYEENGNGEAANASISSVTYGFYLQGSTPTGQEVDTEVPSKDYLTPQFIMSSVGYGASATTWSFEIADFTMRPE